VDLQNLEFLDNPEHLVGLCFLEDLARLADLGILEFPVNLEDLLNLVDQLDQ